MRRGARDAAIVVVLLFCASPPLPGLPALVSAAQVPFEQAVRDLRSADADARLRAARMLKAAAYQEAAIPLAPLVADLQDEVQLEAIAAELNIFLAEPIVPRKRVAFVVEVRNAIAAEAAFSAGRSAVGPRPVPIEVLTALRGGARDDNPRVALEALYAFGVLAGEAGGSLRREVLRASGPDVAALIGSSDPALRYAAVRVMGRLFAKRPQDDAIDARVGDAVITALNDSDRTVKGAAMQSLGAMRYDRAVQSLTDLFQYFGKGESAAAALSALAHIANPASAPLFTAQASSKTAAFRGIAIEGLARVGDRSALDAIQAAVRGERDAGVVLAGAFASAMLGDGSVDRITEALTQSKRREQARPYLVELAPGRSPAFLRYLQAPDARMRIDIIDALGLGGDSAALPVVEPLTKDRDPQVARAAERAVARLQAATRLPT